MIGEELEWPPSLPTKAVLETLGHLLDHTHSGVTPAQHFVAVVREEAGLQERREP